MADSLSIPWREALSALLCDGWSKTAVAQECGASYRTIHRLARGEHERPHRAVLLGLVRLAQSRGLLAA